MTNRKTKYSLMMKPQKTAILILAFFTFQQVIPQQSLAQTAAPVHPVLLNQSQIEIPQQSGLLEDVVVPTQPRGEIVHIQTAHGSFEAQKNIQNIIESLSKQGFKTLFLEGGSGEIHPEVMRFFPTQKDWNGEFVDELAKRGNLTGAELLMIDASYAKKSKSRPRAFGIEDTGAYFKNRKDFQTVLRAREESRDFLTDLDIQIERFSAPYLNSGLKAYLKTAEAFETKRIDLKAWLNYLSGKAKDELKIDLKTPHFQSRWPMLTRYFRLEEAGQKLSMEEFEKEKKAFVLEVKSHGVNEEQIKAFEAVFTQETFKAGQVTPFLYATTLNALGGILTKLPGNFDFTTYENVKRFAQLMIFHAEMRGGQLFDEMSRLDEDIENVLAKNSEEKLLLARLKDYQLLKKLFSLELPGQSFEEINQRRGTLKPSALVEGFKAFNQEKRVAAIEFEHLKEMDGLYALAVSFYEGALKRDHLMAEKALEILRTRKDNKVIVVTGGFHARGIKQFFESKNFSYYLVTPNMTQDVDMDNYYRLMLDGEESIHNSKIENWLATLSPSMRSLAGSTVLNSDVKQALRNVEPARRSFLDRKVLNLYGISIPAIKTRSEVRSGKTTDHDAQIMDKIYSLESLPERLMFEDTVPGRQSTGTAILRHYENESGVQPSKQWIGLDDLFKKLTRIVSIEENLSREMGIDLADIRSSKIILKKEGYPLAYARSKQALLIRPLASLKNKAPEEVEEEIIHHLTLRGIPGDGDFSDLAKLEKYIAQGLPGHLYFGLNSEKKGASTEWERLAENYGGKIIYFFFEVLALKVLHDLNKEKLQSYAQHSPYWNGIVTETLSREQQIEKFKQGWGKYIDSYSYLNLEKRAKAELDLTGLLIFSTLAGEKLFSDEIGSAVETAARELSRSMGTEKVLNELLPAYRTLFDAVYLKKRSEVRTDGDAPPKDENLERFQKRLFLELVKWTQLDGFLNTQRLFRKMVLLDFLTHPFLIGAVSLITHLSGLTGSVVSLIVFGISILLNYSIDFYRERMITALAQRIEESHPGVKEKLLFPQPWIGKITVQWQWAKQRLRKEKEVGFVSVQEEMEKIHREIRDLMMKRKNVQELGFALAYQNMLKIILTETLGGKAALSKKDLENYFSLVENTIPGFKARSEVRQNEVMISKEGPKWKITIGDSILETEYQEAQIESNLPGFLNALPEFLSKYGIESVRQARKQELILRATANGSSVELDYYDSPADLKSKLEEILSSRAGQTAGEPEMPVEYGNARSEVREIITSQGFLSIAIGVIVSASIYVGYRMATGSQSGRKPFESQLENIDLKLNEAVGLAREKTNMAYMVKNRDSVMNFYKNLSDLRFQFAGIVSNVEGKTAGFQTETDIHKILKTFRESLRSKVREMEDPNRHSRMDFDWDLDSSSVDTSIHLVFGEVSGSFKEVVSMLDNAIQILNPEPRSEVRMNETGDNFDAQAADLNEEYTRLLSEIEQQSAEMKMANWLYSQTEHGQEGYQELLKIKDRGLELSGDFSGYVSKASTFLRFYESRKGLLNEQQVDTLETILRQLDRILSPDFNPSNAVHKLMDKIQAIQDTKLKVIKYRKIIDRAIFFFSLSLPVQLVIAWRTGIIPLWMIVIETIVFYAGYFYSQWLEKNKDAMSFRFMTPVQKLDAVTDISHGLIAYLDSQEDAEELVSALRGALDIADETYGPAKRPVMMTLEKIARHLALSKVSLTGYIKTNYPDLNIPVKNLFTFLPAVEPLERSEVRQKNSSRRELLTAPFRTLEKITGKAGKTTLPETLVSRREFLKEAVRIPVVFTIGGALFHSLYLDDGFLWAQDERSGEIFAFLQPHGNAADFERTQERLQAFIDDQNRQGKKVVLFFEGVIDFNLGLRVIQTDLAVQRRLQAVVGQDVQDLDAYFPTFKQRLRQGEFREHYDAFSEILAAITPDIPLDNVRNIRDVGQYLQQNGDFPRTFNRRQAAILRFLVRNLPLLENQNLRVVEERLRNFSDWYLHSSAYEEFIPYKRQELLFLAEGLDTEISSPEVTNERVDRAIQGALELSNRFYESMNIRDRQYARLIDTETRRGRDSAAITRGALHVPLLSFLREIGPRQTIRDLTSQSLSASGSFQDMTDEERRGWIFELFSAIEIRPSLELYLRELFPRPGAPAITPDNRRYFASLDLLYDAVWRALAAFEVSVGTPPNEVNRPVAEQIRPLFRQIMAWAPESEGPAKLEELLRKMRLDYVRSKEISQHPDTFHQIVGVVHALQQENLLDENLFGYRSGLVRSVQHQIPKLDGKETPWGLYAAIGAAGLAAIFGAKTIWDHFRTGKEKNVPKTDPPARSEVRSSPDYLKDNVFMAEFLSSGNLSPAQAQVLQDKILDLSNSKIAEQRGISTRAVERHFQATLKKAETFYQERELQVQRGAREIFVELRKARKIGEIGSIEKLDAFLTAQMEIKHIRAEDLQKKGPGTTKLLSAIQAIRDRLSRSEVRTLTRKEYLAWLQESLQRLQVIRDYALLWSERTAGIIRGVEKYEGELKDLLTAFDLWQKTENFILSHNKSYAAKELKLDAHLELTFKELADIVQKFKNEDDAAPLFHDAETENITQMVDLFRLNMETLRELIQKQEKSRVGNFIYNHYERENERALKLLAEVSGAPSEAMMDLIHDSWIIRARGLRYVAGLKSAHDIRPYMPFLLLNALPSYKTPRSVWEKIEKDAEKILLKTEGAASVLTQFLLDEIKDALKTKHYYKDEIENAMGFLEKLGPLSEEVLPGLVAIMQKSKFLIFKAGDNALKPIAQNKELANKLIARLVPIVTGVERNTSLADEEKAYEVLRMVFDNMKKEDATEAAQRLHSKGIMLGLVKVTKHEGMVIIRIKNERPIRVTTNKQLLQAFQNLKKYRVKLTKERERYAVELESNIGRHELISVLDNAGSIERDLTLSLRVPSSYRSEVRQTQKTAEVVSAKRTLALPILSQAVWPLLLAFFDGIVPLAFADSIPLSSAKPLADETDNIAKVLSGIGIKTQAEAYVFTSEFAITEGGLAVARKVFGNGPIVVIAETDEQRAVIDRFNEAEQKAGKTPFLIAGKVGDAVRHLSGKRAVGVRALDDTISAVSLKEQLSDVVTVTPKQLHKLIELTGAEAMVEKFKALVAFAQSA